MFPSTPISSSIVLVLPICFRKEFTSLMSTSYVSYTKPIFEVIKIPKILEKSSFFACVESKCVI